MQDIVLYGAGGMAKETAELIKDVNKFTPMYNLIAYVVDNDWYEAGSSIRGIPIRNQEWLIDNKKNVVVSIAVGYPDVRRRIYEELSGKGLKIITLIHPSVVTYEGCVIGKGCVIARDCLISSDCKVGDGVLLNGYVTLGHDTVIDNYVTVFPKSQISGNVKVGSGALIGSMTFISEGISIGEGAVVAPGSIVFSKVKPNTHVIGNPAKRIEL